MTGPTTVPKLQIPLNIPKYFALSLRGTISAMSMAVRVIIPPPPIPCRDRPISMWVKFWATPATIAPIVNHAIATSTKGFRPNKSDSEEKTGWKTKCVLVMFSFQLDPDVPAEHSVKEVPVQNASIAVPPSSCDIV